MWELLTLVQQRWAHKTLYDKQEKNQCSNSNMVNFGEVWKITAHAIMLQIQC